MITIKVIVPEFIDAKLKALGYSDIEYFLNTANHYLTFHIQL